VMKQPCFKYYTINNSSMLCALLPALRAQLVACRSSMSNDPHS
jgi:hypothetical protein